MSCVNTELKEFKDAVTRLDIHPDNLELVLHKFLNTEGWGDRFPTDKEILDEIKAKPFEAQSLTDMKYWMTMRYDQPMVFGNLQSALDAVSSVKMMLGDVASMHRNSRGEYVVTVGTPRMSNLSLTFDNTLVDDLLDRIRETNPYHQLLKSIVDLVGKDNIKIRMGLNREHPQIEQDRNPAAYFPDRGEIIFFPENMGWLGENVDTNNRSIFKIAAHELVHQMAYHAIELGRTPAETKFKKEIESLYEEAKKAIGEEYFYGMTNVQEFIAEALTDARFQRRLAEIKSSKDKSLWQKLVNAFSAIFDKIGIKINGSVLADVLSATEEFMSNIGTEREQMAEEEALREEIFLSEMGEELGYESKTLNRIVSSYSNKISDYTYYMFATDSGENKRYAVNIPVNSQDTPVEAQDKVREMLREHGLDPDNYGISKEFKKFGGRDVLYVSPKRTKKSGTSTSQSSVTETIVDNTPTFTDREKSFLDYLDDVRPDLARNVRNGLMDISDLMLNEDEITLFAESKEGVNYYEGNITPSDDTIFVFGSNPEGRHDKGAAKTAHDQFGAQYGVGEGLTGNSYALPTKDLRVKSDGKIDETKLHELQSDEVLIDKFIKGRLGNYTIQDIEEGKVFSGFPKGVVQVQYSINHNVPAVVFEDNNGQRFLLEWDTRRNEFSLAKYNQEQDTYFHVASESRGETDEAIVATKRAVDKFLPKEFVDYARNKAGEDFTKDADFYLEKFNIPCFSPTYEDKNGNTVYKFELRNSEFDNFIKQSLSNSLGNFSDRSLRSIPKETIVESIKKLYDTARRMPNKQFKVAYRNTDKATLNGYTGYEMMEMFKEAGKIPANVVFSKEWVDSGNITTDDYYSADITPTTDALVQSYSGNFEGASNYLVGVVPDALLSKVEDYIMSNGQIGLSEADAQEFLNYAAEAYKAQTTTEQEDNTNQEGQTIKKENQNYMEKAVEITRQIDNLNNSTVLSATEIRHIAEQAVYWISDHITELQETPGKAVEIYDTDGKRGLKDKDFASMTRADVVRTIGPDNMIAMCKEKFSPENTDYEDFDTIEKAEVITDNWGAVMMLASDVFLSVEDFSIVSSKDGTTSEVNEDLVADADNFNQSNQESDVAETEGDQQEHWQVETKTLDVLATMSQMVRQALTKCYLLDKDGNNIKSEFGINKRVNAREATNSILRWTQGALNLEQMVAKLNERADSNPWVRQLVERLSDTSGKESDFQGQFFGTFCKHFQLCSVVIEEDGRYKSIQVNEDPALSEAMTQVTTQYKIGEHPLFTNEGINKTAFSELKAAFEDLEKYNHQGYDLTDETTKMEAATTLGFLATMMGYTVIPEMVATNLNKDTFKRMYLAMSYIVSSLEKNLDNATYEPFKFDASDSINGNTREFLKPITDHLEDIAVSAFYDSGKMYQSYITPSYTSKLFQRFQSEGKDFTDFLRSEYDVPWFHTGRNMERGWRNAWLRQLAKMSAEERKKMFRHKVQLNFNKHNYMKNMSDMEYALSMITEYFSEASRDTQAMVPAWFRVPMLSNKPSSEFIKFYSYRGSNYRDSLTNGFKEIFDQEMSRIQTVEMRNFDKKDSRFIKNFDTNGRKFCFLDFMNEYLTGEKKNSKLGKLIRDKLDGKTIDESKLNELVKEVIRKAMEAKAEEVVSSWEAQGILEEAKKIANIGTTTEEIRENLKNFVWNDTFAAMNIMQLTITDIAYYKDAEDLQKRLAQIHAPGIRGNVAARDYEGNLVTDGNFRTIKLADFDTFISNIIDNVSVVFDRKIEAAKTEGEKAALRALKDSLVGEEGSFRAINVADAQGYSSPTSYRKKALVFGKWSRQAEEVYQKLKAGTYTYSDLQVAFQPLKPFVYSQITKDAGVDGVPLSKMKVPVQFKNSEYLLVMADAILQGENTGRPNLLRAIFNVMEESHYDADGNYKTDGIDTVQFESTVKSGLAGKISLNDLINHPNGEALAKARMEAAIYEHQAEETTDVDPETGEQVTKTVYTRTGNYNNSAVDTVPMEDYCLQQEVPEHFKNHDQAHGSQLRYIIVSELETKTADGEDVTYNLEGRKVSAQEFKAEYEQTIADNIEESINELAEELSLGNIDNIKDRNIALSKILQREILSSPRYGIDLLQACSVDENGRFRIPLGDPIQSKRVEQLINSIIKNRINKQKIAGGPVVQVTNFGTSKELNIRFKDKNGDLLMTRAEYERNPIKREPTQAEKYNAKYKGAKLPDATMSYEDYIKENQAGIAYFEVFAPIYSNSLFTQFADHNGVINMEAIEMLDPDLLKMIGYRIPTEDKYSMAPLKIVGFLPREAGDGIMLPNDITLLTGSDFDVDKEYLMRKDYGIKRNDTKLKDVRKKLVEELMESQADNIKKLREEFNERNEDTHPAIKALTEPGREVRRRVEELVRMFLDDPFDSSILSNVDTADGYLNIPPSAYRKLLKSYLDLTHTVEIPTEGRTYRNNKIVDMTYEVLTHETSADKMLNPGGFDPQKRIGYQVSVFKMPGNKYTWDELGAMSIDQLKKLNSTNKNLSYIDTHIQFYRQNSAAGALIGIFAVNRIAHAVLESGSEDGSSTYSLNVDNICKLDRNFRVAGMDFGGFMPFDMRYDRNGQLIGKVMGSLVASAADAVKDPVLNLMNINSSTANILNSLVRLGMPFDDAALFLSQSVISDVLAEHSRENISGYKSLSKVIEERIEKLQNDNVIDNASNVNSEELTKEELIKGLKDDVNPSIAYKTLIAFSNFQKIAEALRMPTFATRFNSMSSAVGPLIIDNLITEYKMQKLSLESNVVDSSYNPVDMTTIFLEHPILNQFQRTISIARTLFGNMPANSIGFRNILELTKDTPLAATIYGDRKLLSSLSDFYQSCLLMKSGVINPTELGETITEFPKEFMANEYKKKYPDNALIQAIKYGTDKSGRATLQVDITGLDTQQKERLNSGWIDLHKVDPELSIKLFKYNFFRGGVGFSPKTFMGLVPVFVKERIPGYVDTFRILPSITPEIVLDQFIRNNWDNNKLVPRKKVKVTLNEKTGNYEVTRPSDLKQVVGLQYFKTKIDNTDKLLMFLEEREGNLVFKEVPPLGSNKEYIEMSESLIDSPLNVPTTSEAEVIQNSEIAEPNQAAVDAEIDKAPAATNNEDRLNDLLLKILIIEGIRDAAGAEEYIRNYKAKSEQEKARMEKQTKKFFRARFKKLGIKFDEKLIDDVYKLIC